MSEMRSSTAWALYIYMNKTYCSQNETNGSYMWLSGSLKTKRPFICHFLIYCWSHKHLYEINEWCCAAL